MQVHSLVQCTAAAVEYGIATFAHSRATASTEALASSGKL